MVLRRTMHRSLIYRRCLHRRVPRGRYVKQSSRREGKYRLRRDVFAGALNFIAAESKARLEKSDGKHAILHHKGILGADVLSRLEYPLARAAAIARTAEANFFPPTYCPRLLMLPSLRRPDLTCQICRRAPRPPTFRLFRRTDGGRASWLCSSDTERWRGIHVGRA